MMIFALAALASATVANDRERPRGPAVSARATAQATVRLVEGEVVRLGSAAAADPRRRVTTIRLADGEHQAHIVELE